MRAVTLVAVCLVLVATPTLAATVTTEQGEVFVNRGDGYKPVTNATEVAIGQQIMAKARSRAHVVFPDGCAVKVEAGSVFTISARSPCETKEGRYIATEGKHVETGGSLKDDPAPVERDDRRYLIKGLIIAGGVTAGVLILKDNDKDNSPVSP